VFKTLGNKFTGEIFLKVYISIYILVEEVEYYRKKILVGGYKTSSARGGNPKKAIFRVFWIFIPRVRKGVRKFFLHGEVRIGPES